MERTDVVVADLERQRRYYETLIEVSPTAIVTADRDLIVTGWNPAAARLFGYSRDEAIGRHIDRLIADDAEVEHEASELSRRVRGGAPVELITRRRTKDGTLVDVAVKAAAITIEGEVVGVYALYDDVGELVRQRRFFESLLENSPAAVLMADRDMRVTTWNPAAERLFGYTAAEAIGVNVDELVARHPEVHDEAVAYSAQAWALRSFRRLARRTRKDGTLIDVEISAVPVMLEGEAIGFYVIYHDVSELQQAQRHLQARVDDLLAELVRTGQLAKFIPRQVAEGLLAGQLAPTNGFERRKITILSADMVGFTELSETLEPEELSEALNEYLRQMSSVVLAHGGTLDSFIGDGVMALFGAPETMAEEEQAWAAVQAAVEMRARCHELAASLRTRGIPADLAIRVGLNTGHCTLGVFGSEVMRAYKAVGFAVNVASRLQSAGQPGSILCGFRTYALVEGRVRAERREPMMVKGAARPVEAWEIVDVVST